MSKPALIYCPFPDHEAARDAAHALLDEKLIACANLLGLIEAVFVWGGERGSAEEIGVIFKTNDALLQVAIDRLGELHPYDTPAIIGWTADAAHPATATWLSSLR